MANTIQIKRSSTAGSAPEAGDLAQGELALNLPDRKLYTKDASNAVVQLNPVLDGFRNRIINGDMRIDQRNAGASVTAGSGYTLDRWNVDRVWSGSTVTIQQSSTAPTGFTNSLLATVSTGAASASSSYFSVQQYIEANNISDLAFGTASAQTFTVSFWVRSSVTGTFGVCFRNSAFDLSYCTTYTVSAANTWEQKSVTIAAPTTGTWGTGNSYGINVIFSLGGGSSVKPASNDAWVSGNFLAPIGQTDLIATTGATFYITGVQLEAGSVATPFERRPYGTELALCQRYYEIATIPTSTSLFVSYNYSAGNERFNYWQFKQTKRASPTVALGPSASWNGATATIYPGVEAVQLYHPTTAFFIAGSTGVVGITASSEL